MSNSHYDMNLVYIDELFRHISGPATSNCGAHVAGNRATSGLEQRLFRRSFGPEMLPLYEAYAAIWASDDLEYSGGGSTHATAYNYYHN